MFGNNLKTSLVNERGGGNILLVFVITTFVMILIGSIAQYSLVFYRQSFRVKESLKMIEVMEQMSKVIKKAFDENLAQNGGISVANCNPGYTLRSVAVNGKTTHFCFEDTIAERCVADPSNPLAVGVSPYCILNPGVDVTKIRGKENLNFYVQLNEPLPAVAKVGKWLDRKIVSLGLDQGDLKPILENSSIQLKTAHAQSLIEQSYVPANPNTNLGIITPSCANGDADQFHDNLCVICEEVGAGAGLDRRDNLVPAGPNPGGVARCVTFRVCALWAIDDPANPTACAANGYWYQKIALISNN